MAALIKFTQGANTPVAGRAIDAVTGSTVSCANGGTDAANIVSWNWNLVDVPPGSALAVGTLGSTSTATVPALDATGTYLVKLVTTDTNGVVTSDYRAIMVTDDANYQNRYIPGSFALSLAEQSHNLAGQTRGYAPFLESFLKVISRLRDWAVTAPVAGQTIGWDATNKRWAPNPLTQLITNTDASRDFDNVLAPTTTTGTGANVLFAFATTSGCRYYVSGFLECTSGTSSWFYEFKATFDNIAGTLTQRSVTVTQLYGTNTTPVITVPVSGTTIQLSWSGLASVKVKGRLFLHEGQP